MHTKYRIFAGFWIRACWILREITKINVLHFRFSFDTALNDITAFFSFEAQATFCYFDVLSDKYKLYTKIINSDDFIRMAYLNAWLTSFVGYTLLCIAF